MRGLLRTSGRRGFRAHVWGPMMAKNRSGRRGGGLGTRVQDEFVVRLGCSERGRVCNGEVQICASKGAAQRGGAGCGRRAKARTGLATGSTLARTTSATDSQVENSSIRFCQITASKRAFVPPRSHKQEAGNPVSLSPTATSDLVTIQNIKKKTISTRTHRRTTATVPKYYPALCTNNNTVQK